MAPPSSEPGPAIRTVRDYYRQPAVVRRIREYCGLTEGEPPGAAYLVSFDPGFGPYGTWDRAPCHPAGELDRVLGAGGDVARSLWDRRSLLVHLDIDVLNPDRPATPFLDPAGTFLRIEPLYSGVRSVLWELEMPLLALMTGQGYHFTGRVPLGEPLVDRLARLVPDTPAWFATHASRCPEAVFPAPPLLERTARAWTGLGLLLEHLAHRVLRNSARSLPLPLVLNGTLVGRGPAGREALSLDLSYLGDPLDRRNIRAAFGAYQKHLFRPDVFGAEAGRALPAFAAVPRDTRRLDEMLPDGRSLSAAARLAGTVSARLPDVSRGLGRLLADYQDSPAAAVHRRFYGVVPLGPDDWPSTTDRLDPDSLVPCLAAPLRQPNDRLLKPEVLQHLVRGLMSRGWEPRHIAGLVHSFYARDHAWGRHWRARDPALRAEVDVRIFSTLIRAGLDEAVDFNCVSAQEKGLCPRTGCRHDLRFDRARLLKEAVH